MKRLLFLAALCFYFCACKNEKLAIAGSGWNEIAIIDKKSGIIEWKHALEPGSDCNDIEITPEGNILYAYSKGAKLINRKHETLWDYKAGKDEEIHTATRLPDGGIMVAVCGEPARIVEFDPTGKQTKEIKFNTLTFNINNQFRQVAKTKDGVYLVPLIEKRTIMRLKPDGSTMRMVFIGYDVFSVKPLENDNLLVSCGVDSRFVEKNPELLHRDSMTVTKEVHGAVLLYVAEIIPYENGNKLIANSNMYSSNKSQPLLVEVDKNNNVVWTLPYNRAIRNITAVHSFFE